MFCAYIKWFKAIGQWARDQDFCYSDELVVFCFMFLVTGIVLTGIIVFAWFTTIGKILAGVLLIMLSIFINCKYSNYQDKDCG